MSTRDQLLKVERTAILLGHSLGPWKQNKNRTYSCRCKSCGRAINVKIGLRLSDLPEEMCKGKQE